MTTAYNTAREIATAWQQTIEASQESGDPPWLFVGQSDSLVDGLPALSACRRLARTRADLAVPQSWAGGGSAWWSTAQLYATAQARTIGAKPGPSAMMARYAGPDTATVMATLTVHAPMLGSAAEREWLNGLPAGMASFLQPQSAPGVIAPWASLPFAVMEPGPSSDEPAIIDWTAIAAVILALCIVVLALIL